MNEKIDWKKKLTSRKFWAAICTFVSGLIAAFGGTEDQGVKITGLIMAGAAVIAYIIGEGLVDAANKSPERVALSYEEQPPLPEEEDEDDNG